MPLDPWEFIDAAENVGQGLGDWIANGSPNTDIGQAVQDRFRNRCDEWSNLPAWYNALTPLSRNTLENICDPWLTANNSGGPVPDIPPFSGGQCVCSRYRLRLQVRRTDGSAFGSVVNRYLFGPLGMPRRVVTPLGNDTQVQWVIPCRGNSNSTGGGTCGAEIVDVQLSSVLFTNSGDLGWTLEYQLVTPILGDPDNCGDLPTSPAPNPNPRPLPPPSPDDEPYTKPGDDLPTVPLPPVSGPVDVNIQLPDFVFPGEKTGAYNPASPVNPGTPIESTGNPEGGNPEDDFGDPPENEVWVGFTVELLNQSRTQSGFIPSAEPDTVYPQPVGGVYAILDIGGETVVGPYVSIRNRATTWLTPILGVGVTGARVHLKYPSTQYRITPLSQPIGED